MNPYLEQASVWHSFHEQFCTHCMETLAAQVRPRYVVRLDQHVYLHEPPADGRVFVGRADIYASVNPGRPATPPPTASPAATAPAVATIPAPPVRVTLRPPVDAERLSFVEIRDASDRRLVTVVELLSPINKRGGPDREQYLAKMRRLYASDVHVIEIDLLRGGLRSPIGELPDCDYCVTVARVEERPEVGVWPLRLRDPLPVIPVPLRPPDPDARLDLQALLHRLYDAGGYEDDIYAGRPQPPLHPSDEAWARGIIAAVGGPSGPPGLTVPPAGAEPGR
jgi:hypothetical protein